MGITSRLFFIYWKVQVHIKKQRELPKVTRAVYFIYLFSLT